MVMIAPRTDPALGAAPPGGDAAMAAQLEEALLSANPQQLAQFLTALKQMSDKSRGNVLDQIDPAALQVLMEAIMQLVQGQGAPPSAGAQAGAGPRPGGGMPSMGGMPGFPGMGAMRPPSMPGMTNPAAPARHAPVNARTPGLTSTEPAPAMRGAGKTPAKLREKHAGPANSAQLKLSPAQARDTAAFKAHFEKNRARYDAVAQKTNMPPELIASLHWRESNGNFNTYLHQGDPLGKPATHVPRNIPVFHKWEDSAVHALGQKANYQQALGLTKDSTDKAAMASYAELYNGLGYHFRNQPSPYVYSGTDKYSSGKYVADGVYDPRTVDRQVGVLALMQSLGR